jgi:hypothetical protein
VPGTVVDEKLHHLGRGSECGNVERGLALFVGLVHLALERFRLEQYPGDIDVA